jgi:hypothetical protein
VGAGGSELEAEGEMTIIVTKQRPISTGEDVGRGAVSGLKKGTEALIGTAEGAGQTGAFGIHKLYELAKYLGYQGPEPTGVEQGVATAISGTLNPVGQIAEFVRDAGGPDLTDIYAPSPQSVKQDIESAVPASKGLNYDPQTFLGKTAEFGGELAPMVAAGPGSLVQKAAMVPSMAFGGEGAKSTAAAFGASPGWQEVAKFGGSLIGGAMPDIWNAAMQPHPIPPTRQPAVDIMDARRVPLSVGQRTGDESLLRRERMAGGPEAWDQQPAAFTRAATETQGGFPTGTDVLPNATMRAELNRMGAEFDRLAGLSSAQFDQHLLGDLTNIIGDYRQNPVVGGRVEAAVNGLFDHAMQNGGAITGEGYARFRTHIGDIIRNTDDAAEREAMLAVQDRVDAEIQANLPPAEQHAWRTVRAQYRNYLPIEFAKSGQGQTKREGFVDPQSLMTGIRNVEGRREVSSGNRDMTQLAEAGGTTMIKPNSSGTAENLREQLAGLIPIIGGGAGASLGSLLPGAGGPLAIALATLGAGAGYALPKIRDAFIRSGAGQAFMGRNIAPRIATDRSALAAAVAAEAIRNQAGPFEEKRRYAGPR